MKNLPFIPRLLLNIVLFWVYFIIWSVIAAVIYGIGWMLFAYSMPQFDDPVFDKIGYIVLLVTFVITLVFRKYFYMSLSQEKDQEEKKKKYDFSME